MQLVFDLLYLVIDWLPSRVACVVLGIVSVIFGGLLMASGNWRGGIGGAVALMIGVAFFATGIARHGPDAEAVAREGPEPPPDDWKPPAPADIERIVKGR